MPLHLDYRPKTLEELHGNASVKQAVGTILAREDRPRAWLLTGPSGCGKTTLARIIADAVGCNERDCQELNISDARGIDDARKIMQSMAYMPQAGAVRVFVLDECQQATPAFQQSVLKALEDTPPHVVFILCTTDPDKLIKTIRTRCSTFELRPLPAPEMRALLASVAIREGVGLPDEAYEEIILAAEGSPRQALVILDQVIDIADDQEMVAAIRRTRLSQATLKDLMDLLLDRASWKAVAKVLDGFPDGTDWESVRRGVLGWADKVLRSRGSEQAATVIHCFREPLFNSGRAGFDLACWTAVL